MSGIDWPGLLRVGVQGLALAPDAFWRLTPVELRIMIGAEAMVPPLTRARLDELARAFPDKRSGGDGGIRQSGRSGRGTGGDAERHGRDGGGV